MRGPRPVTAALNRLLHETPLAMERLRKHAGRTVCFDIGPLPIAWTVRADGAVASADPRGVRDLSVRVSPFALPRLAAGDEAAWREAHIEGDAELAQEVSFLARNLRWDPEEALSRLVGDIAAERLVGALRGGARWGRETVERTAAAAMEYWTEEAPLVASRVKVEDFVRGVDALRDDIERLDKRLAALSPAARD